MEIAVDWGSSNFRAWLFDCGGNVVAVRDVPDGGVLNIASGAFEVTLRAYLGEWLDQAERVTLSGMVTSRNGWVETSYLPCPGSISELHTRAVHRRYEGLHCVFLPGLCQTTPRPDVMRGEELQILGAMNGRGDEIIVLPGTHSKWAYVHDGSVQNFGTWMTGELFDLVRNKSLAGKLAVESAWNLDAFSEGLEAAGRESPFAAVFEARSGVLLGTMAPSFVNDYLSGLLIGCEVREAMSLRSIDCPVILVAAPNLVVRYHVALTHFGVVQLRLASDATQLGFARLIAQTSPAQYSF